MRDPHEVLGVTPAANARQITDAYRRLAKRLHPDHAGPDPSAEQRMAELNIAYELLRDALGGQQPSGAEGTSVTPRAAERPPPRAGHWLPEALCRRLGRELLEALDEREPVHLVAPAATWNSPSSIVVLTDRRLLWLGEDAVMGRVRSLRLRDLIGAKVGTGWRGRAKLRLLGRDGRRHSFTELDPARASEIARAVEAANARG